MRIMIPCYRWGNRPGGRGSWEPQSFLYTTGRAKLDPWSQGLTTWSGPFPSFSLGGADAGGYFAVRFLHLGEDDPSSILGSWEIGGKQSLGGSPARLVSGGG